MSEISNKVEADRKSIVDAKQQGTGATLFAYTRLSGPGWLQSAITLGGGSLAGSLYLGVIGGYQMLWLQPLMMILGVVMLSAIGYVALSTGERPFRAINQHVNPVLGWGWAIATLMANLVWAMPQFALGTAALEKNLMPGIFSGSGGKYAAAGLLFVIGAVVIWFYDRGGKGIKIFEAILKIMVGVVVVAFFGVTVTMASSIPWGEVFQGFIPNLGLLFSPADGIKEAIAASTHKEFWEQQVLATQRDRMVTAAATAVGINMTFLLPYSMLKRGWDRDFRGLAVFDLSTGLFIPFVLATSCVVIAASLQFHGKYDEALVGEVTPAESENKDENADTEPKGAGESGGDAAKGPSESGKKQPAPRAYIEQLDKLLKHDRGEKFSAMSDEEKQSARQQLPIEDRRLAAMLMSRDADALANSLQGLAGEKGAQVVFGIGVLGMAISTIIILMLINGFTICELFDVPSEGTLHRIGSLLPGITGALGFLFLWSDGRARFWLAVPTSVFGMVLLPIAYVTFFLMMNNRKLLGEHLPRGGRRIAINAVMSISVIGALVGASWSIWGRVQNVPGTEIKVRWVALALAGLFVVAAVLVGLTRRSSDDRT